MTEIEVRFLLKLSPAVQTRIKRSSFTVYENGSTIRASSSCDGLILVRTSKTYCSGNKFNACNLIVSLFPYSDTVIVGHRHHELTRVTDGKVPNLRVVRSQLLDIFKFDAVPVLHHSVLGATEKVFGFWYKLDFHDCILMPENRLVTVSKVQSPNPYVFICGRRDYQFRVKRDINRKHRKLVSVQAEEKLERVEEEDLDGVIQQSNSQVFGIWRNLNTKHIVAHLQRSSVIQL
ncbi:hypothetical protein OGATHE_001113 [Ogataea polymorpha]|uniref:Uncharacterized protein n=1 Tax=Ogataea polymorpha TaxID=460523 RepID=A0A9P8TF85_9ASCO|nr:hypothetical protein OGATHE_001113 [Ogataea polymorpha]